MKEKLETLLKEGTARIEATQSEAELQEVKGALLGKQGSITELLKEIPKLDVALRPEMGKAVNNVKSLLTEQINPKAAPADDYLLDKHYLRKHGANAYNNLLFHLNLREGLLLKLPKKNSIFHILA